MTDLDIRAVPRVRIIGPPVEAVYAPRVRALCRCPYDGHPAGCPNFGKRPDCPPTAPLFAKVCCPSVRIIAVRFAFGAYLRRKRRLHPDWTERALRNPRHWQGHVRAELRRFVAGGCDGALGEDDIVLHNPEAMGVDVTATCTRAGIGLEWPPRRYAYEVALIARPAALSGRE